MASAPQEAAAFMMQHQTVQNSTHVIEYSQTALFGKALVATDILGTDIYASMFGSRSDKHSYTSTAVTCHAGGWCVCCGVSIACHAQLGLQIL